MKIKLIDFWAAWCGPCRMLSPVIDELKEDYKNNENVEIIKINVDDDPESSVVYNVRALPTLLFLNSDTNEVLGKYQGTKSKKEIQELIEQYLSTK